MRPSVCACLPRALLLVCPCGCLLRHRRALGSRLSPRVYASVGGCHRRPSGPQGLRVSAPREGGRGGRWQPRAVGSGGGGDSGRGRGAGRRGVCGGPEAAVRVGSACAGEQRPPPAPGPARPPQVSLPPRSGPPPRARGPWDRRLPGGIQAPNRTPGDAPHPPPTVSLDAKLAAEDVRLPVREPAPRRAGRRRSSRFPVGTPERPGPR